MRVVSGEIVYHTIAFENQKMIHHLVHEIAIVTHHNDASTEVCQILFEQLERSNVKIVRRFVKDKEVRSLHQHQTELQTTSLPSGKFVDIILLTSWRKQKVGKKLQCREVATSSQIHRFSHITHHINHFHLRINRQPILREIAKLYGFSHHKTPARGRNFSKEHFNERTFPRSIVSHDPHFLKAREIVVEIFENNDTILKSFRHIFSLKNLRTNVSSLHIKSRSAFLSASFRLLFEFVESLLARTTLVTTCLRLSAHPVEFFAIEIARFVNVSIGSRNAFVAFLQIVGIISLITICRLLINLDNRLTHTVEKIAIVRHQEESFSIALQIFLQPFNHLQIQMVSGFVENEQVGISNEH